MKLRQTALAVSDLPRAITFYSALLGSQPIAVFDGAGLAFFDLNGTRFMLDSNLKPGATSTLLYFGVGDVQSRIEELRASGVEIATEPHVVFPDEGGIFDAPGDEWLAFIRDSEGNMIGLMSRQTR